MMKRWRMNRMGILNFWLYDEEVFELEQGRLLFRGANGSGKSVTMQSFIPLVLDGDKRPVIWIEPLISGLSFIMRRNRAIKLLELPCGPEEGRHR